MRCWQPQVLAVLAAQVLACGVLGEGDFFYDRGLPEHVKAPTSSKSDGDIRVLTNLWYTSTRYTYVVESPNPAKDVPEVEQMLSSNLGVHPLPVQDTQSLYSNVKAAYVPGITLLLDFPFPAFPDNLGTWVELLLPLYSQMAEGRWRELVPADVLALLPPSSSPPGEDKGGAAGLYIDRVLLINLKRGQIQNLHWAWHMLRLALRPATAPGRVLPRMVFFEELEFLDQSLWLCYQAAIAMHDRGIGGRAGFAAPELGRAFRAEAYALAGVGDVPQVPDRTITYLMSVGGEVVYNNDDVLDGLRDIAEFLEMRAMPTSLTPHASFQSFVATMAKTGVLVTRHGPQMANAIFLPPGAVVMELLALNWDWRGSSDIYFNATGSVGDIHHFAWRAPNSRWAVFAEPEDAKYDGWTIDECMASRQCLDVHARAGMLVDTSAVHEALMDTLPAVLYRNASVASLRRPFPKGTAAGTSTGFWSDK